MLCANIFYSCQRFLIMILLCATILDSQQRFLINDDPSKYIDLGVFTTR